MIQISRLKDGELRSEHSSRILQPGQPFWDGNNNQLYVGNGTSTLQDLKPVGKPQAGTGIEVVDIDSNDAPAKLNLKIASSNELGGVKLGYATKDATSRPLLIQESTNQVYTSLPKIDFRSDVSLKAAYSYSPITDSIQATYFINLAKGTSGDTEDSTDFSGLSVANSPSQGQSAAGLKLLPATNSHLGGVKISTNSNTTTTRYLSANSDGEAYITIPSLTFSSGVGIAGEITSSTDNITVQCSLKAGSEENLGGIKYAVTNTTPTTFQAGTFYFVTT